MESRLRVNSVDGQPLLLSLMETGLDTSLSGREEYKPAPSHPSPPPVEEVLSGMKWSPDPHRGHCEHVCR